MKLVFGFLSLFVICAQQASAAPRVFLFSAKNLEIAHDGLKQGDEALQPALKQLIREADEALKTKPASVMDKPKAAASGDKHDYFSYGPYWWPDPAKPDGLPYIRRDGETNPDSKKNTDSPEFRRTCAAIETLSLAYYFTVREAYASHAATLARVWFLDPATRMNPNLNHAQAIPGINNGRGIGIIEARALASVIDSLELISASPSWTKVDRAAFKTWIGDYYHWLVTSTNGTDEQGELNNHGTWYDVQAAYLALSLDRMDEAKKILTTGLARRLAAQIEPDGSQPRELARTKSFEYSLFNLEALFTCARLADHAGVDWWTFTTADGRSLQAALAYLALYIDTTKAWPKKDLVNPNRNRLLPLFACYLAHRKDPLFQSLFVQYAPAEPTARWHLLWPELRAEKIHPEENR